MQAPSPELDPDQNIVVLPVGTLAVSPMGIAAVLIVFAAAFGASFAIKGGDYRPFAVAFAILAILLPLAIALLNRVLGQMTPLRIDGEGVMLPTLLGASRVPWSDIDIIVVTGFARPVVPELRLYWRTSRRVARQTLPAFAATDLRTFLAIIENIARENGVRLAYDDTDEGKQMLNRIYFE